MSALRPRRSSTLLHVELHGGKSDTLAAVDDLHVIGRRADLARRVIGPMMKRSFTRRLVLTAYEALSPRHKLPADLGVRAQQVYQPLDPSRFVREYRPGFTGSGARPMLLRDVATEDRYIFKCGTTSNLKAESQGIDSVTQPIRATAAAVVADILGVQTPYVRLVEYSGQQGSLQNVITDTRDLSRLAKEDPAGFQRLIHGESFARQRSDMWVLDRAIGNMDRQSHNILMRDSPSGPQLIAIDHDLSFPPVRDYSLLLGVRGYTPRRVTLEAYQRLQNIAPNPSTLRSALAPLLTGPEIDAVVGRIEDTLQIIEKTVAQRGAATFF